MSHLDNDIDPQETSEWLDALKEVIERDGADRAQYLLSKLSQSAESSGMAHVFGRNTAYKNTLSPLEEKKIPPDEGVGKRIQALIRWNAVAMVVNAGKKAPELGGHIASYASAATLYEVGFNYFFKGQDHNHSGDLLFIQGHSSPGIYARAYLEGRLTEEQLYNFRQEVEVDGLSSYPHPWLMGDFWQFPTVSMGLGPMQAIYQARFLKYLENRGFQEAANRRVWAFLGDGETDEPESLGAISIAARERLDNLTFVVNCNLQRLDGPVRGNGKIIQELEAIFRGAGWHVIKVVWGSRWDPLFAMDKQGLMQKRMEECVDGDFQAYKAHDGAYVRDNFFGQYPELKKMVENMSDEEIWRLNRGGHDAQKVYAAYSAACEHKGSPTVILAKTVKGYGMGAAGEGQNFTHQQKKMSIEQLRAFRDRFNIPIADDQIESVPFYRPSEDSPEIRYLKKQREQLGGSVPARRQETDVTLAIPELSAFEPLLKGSGDREISTTMAFVRILNILLKDKNLAKYVVPIVPDECRTFGMEGLFRQIGIYSPVGQLYTPVDHEQVMYYREAKDGQILEEGINEAGAFCSWIAAATSYSTNNLPMIPFYIYYSMFGFQRIGDLAWAAGDMKARGFLLGGTAGRTVSPSHSGGCR
jgi:pyruvate dehydrogenase E1 component